MTDLIDRFDTTGSDTKPPKTGPHRFYSDRLKWVVFALFIVGLFFKNRHWPFAGLMIVASSGFSALLVIGQLIEGIKFNNYSKALFGISIGLSMIYLVFRFQYWQGGTIVLVLAILSVMATAFYLISKKRTREINKLALSLIFVGMFIFTLPMSQIFYYTNMSKTLNNWEHYNSANAWGRYGDFLMSEGDEKGAGMAYIKSFTCSSREEGGEVYQEMLDEIMEE